MIRLMEMVFIGRYLEKFTKDNGLMINLMEKENKHLLMDQSTKVTLSKGQNTVMASIYGSMDKFTKASGRITNSMDTEITPGMTIVVILANGAKT